ncbi:MAG: D-alanyl-D-alanine carboxypeptidase [Clostridiales bacterium]|nr:D-alanyl-D-alanine carboxypeptidase [Clostridiales bacterium]
MKKRILTALLLTAAFVSLLPGAWATETEETTPVTISAKAGVLMERETGTVLYEENAHEALEPASVTKVMTMLLVAEAIDSGSISLEDTVTASAYAASMGGSQVYLEEGEQMTVSEMLKAVAVASGNDAAVALAEHLRGSEEAFVAAMNQRAAELGMEDTHFCNCTGLPAEGHVTSAYDIAVMSRELLSHEVIRDYTGIWMDTLRNGTFQLANTNKLIYYYDGATGLKTGFTQGAGFCISASAERDGMELIAVVLGSETSSDRFESAKTLLNYGFGGWTVTDVTGGVALPPVSVTLGEAESVPTTVEGDECSSPRAMQAVSPPS